MVNMARLGWPWHMEDSAKRPQQWDWGADATAWVLSSGLPGAAARGLAQAVVGPQDALGGAEGVDEAGFGAACPLEG